MDFCPALAPLLYNHAVAVARPIRAVKTDALWFAGAEPTINKDASFEGIGKWGVRPGGLKVPDIVHKPRKSTYVPLALASIPIEELHVNDERDLEEMGTLLDANNYMLIRGDVPGVGKSFALEHHCAKETTLFVAPTNRLCAKIAQSGFHAVTLDKLLGLRVGGHDTHDMDITCYSTIVFDEIFFHGVSRLSRIRTFMRKYERLDDYSLRKFYATGDPFQNPPIAQLDTDDNRAYYMDAVSTIFSSQLTLHICKRVKNPLDQEKLEMIKHRLFVLKESPSAVLRNFAKPIRKLENVKGSAICFKNKTANAINNTLHAIEVKNRTDLVKVGGCSYYPGLELVCRERLDNVMFADAKGEFNKRGVLQVNFSYKVEKATDAALILTDCEGGRVNISTVQAVSNLSYAHAFTGHSQQGLSIDGPVTIFDAFYSFFADGRPIGITAEWVYTALSRARNMDQLYVFVGKLGNEVGEREVRIALEKKILGHKVADKKAGRKWDETEYITADEVFSMYAKDSKCAECSEKMELDWNSSDHRQVSIDRKDSEKPHHTSNCQLLCLSCNKKKQDK